ncbi:MAG: carboxypeptidase-like regulatory domain-containing protein [Sphingobacteriales bacterium]|nr:MAG: carboxypeptidase-like regulatory domain-containing protein [Sphingobacteriales bacterium]
MAFLSRLLLALLLGFLLPLAGHSQQFLWGRLLDEVTGEPVAGASIYVNNSQVRTLSDSSGRFRIPARHRGGSLLVTHMAYEKTDISMTGTDTLLIALHQKNEVLGSVTVTAKARDSWKKWGAVFTEYFIGSGEAASSCRLLNPEALVFSYNETAGILGVRARAPLELENRLLGYRVHIDLDYFRFYFSDGHFTYLASSFYEPLAPVGERESLAFAAQRLLAYGGSRQHFVRALYEGRLAAEGFHLYGFRARANAERARVEALLLRERARQNSLARDAVTDNKLLTSGMSRDSVRYYTRVLNQPGYLFEDSVRLNLAARWAPTGSGTAFRIPDSLLLRYAPTAGINDAAVRLGRWGRWAASGTDAYTFLESPDAFSRYALLYLQGDSLLRGNKEGVVENNAALYTEGYLSQRRTAFTLPLDYRPAADEALLAGRTLEPDADELQAARVDSLLSDISRRNDASRIYLHLDKSSYDRFEHVWFSAYLLHSTVPAAAHRTLQVMLVRFN